MRRSNLQPIRMKCILYTISLVALALRRILFRVRSEDGNKNQQIYHGKEKVYGLGNAIPFVSVLYKELQVMWECGEPITRGCGARCKFGSLLWSEQGSGTVVLVGFDYKCAYLAMKADFSAGKDFSKNFIMHINFIFIGLLAYCGNCELLNLLNSFGPPDSSTYLCLIFMPLVRFHPDEQLSCYLSYSRLL